REVGHRKPTGRKVRVVRDRNSVIRPGRAMSDEPRNEEPKTEEMLSITLENYPVALANRAGRHYEAIQREFALIHFSDEATRASVPSRLLELAERTRAELARGEIIAR